MTKRRWFWMGVVFLAATIPDRPGAAAAERPNILFCIADDATYPHLGAYGCPWVTTPAIDRVARDGLLFTQLFDLIRDPECITNLADIPHYQIVKAALKQQLWRELRAQRDPRMFDQGQRFDQYIYADPRTRNFYERFMRGEPVKAGWVNPSDFEKSSRDRAPE